MEILNPLMLWGMLAVAIPVILHLWHQKRGKLLPWAATQWLSEKKLQPSKGLKPDNILLLILRILLLILLSLYLAKPLLNALNKGKKVRSVHLIEPEARLADNFRFEIEEALKKGEKVYWLNQNEAELTEGSAIPASPVLNANTLQSSLNKLAGSGKLSGGQQLHIYLLNRPALNGASRIFVPGPFTLHTLTDTTGTSEKQFLVTDKGQQLFTDASGRLTTGQETAGLAGEAAHKGPVRVLLRQKDKTERQTLAAALRALQEVYGIVLEIDEAKDTQKKYDWVFDDGLPENPDTSTLYVISGAGNIPEDKIIRRANVRYMTERADPARSQTIFNGQLPEWLGEILAGHYHLENKGKPLSRQQLSSLFKTSGFEKNAESAWFSTFLLTLFILILGWERWLAIHKNA